MRKTLFLGIFYAFIGVAAAECDFPYYPEFADVFCQYDEVTPNMAIKYVVAEPAAGLIEPGDKVCEPLLIRDFKGMPFCYMVAVYRGTDLDIAREWNEIVKRINEGKRWDADELKGKIEYFKSDEVERLFARLTISTYTSFIPMLCASDRGIPFALWYYPQAYEKAIEDMGHRELYLNRIIGESFDYNQTFEFEDAKGDKAFIRVSAPGEKAVVVNADEVERDCYIRAEYMAQARERDPDSAAKYNNKWAEYNARIPDEVVIETFPEVQESITNGGIRDEGCDTDPVYLEQVPDVDLSVSPYICWANAVAAIIVYHSQHNSFLEFKQDWKEPIPFFKEDSGASSKTQQFIKAIAGAYYAFVNNPHPSSWEACCKIQEYTVSRNYNGVFNHWLFTYWGWVGYGSTHEYVTRTDEFLEWEAVTSIPVYTRPLVGLIPKSLPNGVDHAAPVIGYYVPAEMRYLVLHDMRGTLYDKFYQPFWEDWELYTYDEQEGIKIVPPITGPTQDRWVTEFSVKNEWRKAEINWVVGSTSDVQGFNVYVVNGDGGREKINDELIKVGGENEKEFSITAKKPPKGGFYALELVRFTDDECEYIYTEDMFQ